MNNTKLFYRTMGVCLSAVIAFSGITALSASANDALIEQYPPIESEIDYSKNDVYYFEYLKENEGANAENSIAISLEAAASSDGKNHISSENGVTYFDWSDDGLEWVEWSVNVTNEGYYNLAFDYMTVSGTIATPSRALTVDGEELFRELSEIQFPRIWADKNEPIIDDLGDAVSPQQIELEKRQIRRITDSMGRYTQPLKIYFTKGQHTIRLEMQQEFLEIYGISLEAPLETEKYSDVLEKYKAAGYKEASENSSIKIDAESAVEKSDVALQRTYNSNPCADPASKGNKILNTIGGDNWNEGNQTITWKFNVEEAALYRMDLRLFTKYSDEINIYRQIAIDGAVPFREFENYCFEYDNWRTEALTDENGDPYLIYLTEGEHTLSISVVTASYLNILCELEEALELLSEDIQKIIKVTSVSPDSNFDYQLDKKIPNLLDDFTDVAEKIGQQMSKLEEEIGEVPSGANSLLEIKYRLEKMVADPYIIARNLSYLQDSETTLSDWINAFNNLPIELDYIVFNSPDAEIDNPQATVFQHLWSVVRNFVLSFSKDYDSINGTESDNENETIKVWISRGKEWGTVLKQLSDENFTPQNNIDVEYNILPAGQLGTGGVMMLAVASGTEPDIALGLDYTVPAEYGMREVAMDLSEMDDYAEIEKRFAEGTMIPYYLNGKTYGLPETIDFGLLFYRKDILLDLNLVCPDTWDEVFNYILPTIKRNGMDFWFEGGLNVFLFQNGGSFYNEDGTKSALDTEAAQEAFKMYSDLYKVYDVPYESNFYTRFRSGQMPIGISTLSNYIKLKEAAPELKGKWDIALIPGIKQEDGTIRRDDFVSGTSIMIFNSTKSLEAAWKFAKWYTSAETQKTYADMLQATVGSSSQWFSANTEAFSLLSWTNKERKIVNEQLSQVQGMPTVIGGYITSRNLENARVRTVIQGMNYRESIEKAVEDINLELELKRSEFEQRTKKEGEE